MRRGRPAHQIARNATTIRDSSSTTDANIGCSTWAVTEWSGRGGRREYALRCRVSSTGTFAACPTRNWGWVSCLGPGFVATDINTSERDRPKSAAPGALDKSAEEMRRKLLDEMVAAGMRPEAVDDPVHDAARNDHRPEHGDRARRQARQHHAEPEPGAPICSDPSGLGRPRWHLRYRSSIYYLTIYPYMIE